MNALPNRIPLRPSPAPDWKHLWAAMTSCAASLTLAASAFAASPPEPHQCKGLPVTVAGATASDASSVCQGAGAAIAFFASQGFAVPPTVRVKVQERLPSAVAPGALGCFSPAEDVVFLLPYSRFRKSTDWPGLPGNRHMYVSAAIHEVAHALGSFNSSVPHPSTLAAEYVAYVAMFSGMDPETRARLLQAHPRKEAQSAERLRPALYMFDPFSFGVSAYRHYIEQADGPGFLRDVLSGKVLNDY